jgi:hypothetical protein
MLREPLMDGFTLEELADTGHHARIAGLEPDVLGYVDDNAVKRVPEVRDVTAVAASRMHIPDVRFEWSKAFGGGPRHAEGPLWGQFT